MAEAPNFLPEQHRHLAIVRRVEDFRHDSFRTEEVQAGVVAIIGTLQNDEKEETCAYRFDAEKFTTGDVGTWLGKRRLNAITINPAAGKQFPQLTSGANLLLPASLTIRAASATEAPRCSIVAYTGGLMSVRDYGQIVIDLSGLELPGRIPLLCDHDDKLAGITGSGTARVENRQLLVDGSLVSGSAAAQQIIGLHKAGVPLGASVGVEPLKTEHITGGRTITVNGKQITAPGTGFTLVRRGRLREVSLLAVAADPETSVSIAAKAQNYLKGRNMDDNQSTETIRAAAVIETGRVNTIRASANRHRAIWGQHIQPTISAALGNVEARAIAEGWNEDRTELAMMEAARPNVVISNTQPNVMHGGTGPVLEAALMMHAGHEGIAEREYGPQVAQQARDMGIRHTLDVFKAWYASAGVQAPSTPHEMIQGALHPNLIQASSAFSTTSLPNILSNVQGKTLLNAYQAFPSTARMVATMLSASDFKEKTGLRLAGETKLLEVGKTGEIKHGVPGEFHYHYQLGTFARMMTITRQDIINDDTGAFGDLPRLLGRGAATALEEAFWTLVLANTGSFFVAGNNNYQDGAGTALGIDSLGTAVATMLKQTDQNGYPISVLPRFLVCPPELKATADSLYRSTIVVSGTANSDRVTPNANTFFGLAEPAVSPYISNTNFTGNSTKQWYLFGNPGDVAAFGIAFLNGAQTPVIESMQTDPEILGVTTRAFFDFGVCQIDPRGAVYSKGQA